MGPRTLTIRPAHAGDAAVILRVHREAILAKAAGHYPQATLEAWAVGVTAERLARMEQQIADPGFIFLVAAAGDEVLGYGAAVPSRGELGMLYVKPNPFGRVGSALLEELEKRAFQVAAVLTCDASLNAVDFYRVHGYAEVGTGEHPLRSGGSVPCVRMSKFRPPSG